jgi:uroporphyrin-III C-methyltransferase/precorrin-2 dehydrogenase/sirohydrochlorin ferrochelatase
MRPLATLPVFLDVAGRRAVVAGGSARAAWKAELLLAAGAQVEVWAETLEPEMVSLINGRTDGSIRHHPRRWQADALAGAAVAFADIDDDVEAKAFAAAACAAGVPVNLIDKPAHCQFQVGAIVNRSPIVIGISTNGAAPVLGQAIRQRIEALLPPWLASWGELASTIRNIVTHQLPDARQRRQFWEGFARRAFTAPPSDGDKDLMRMTPAPPAGRVTLVGAGPGDAELLTVKAVRALQSADVILFDDLVSDDVLELARREARRLLVGKRGRRESCRQDDINALMVKLARQGKHVVRLKSGDPMIFGRAGEEIEILEAHGIEVTVVPGITAALAAAATLRTSLTHRDHAHSVRFITGHSRDGTLPEDLDWKGLADPQTTLVFYMGGRTAPTIADRLLSSGLAASTPVIIAAGIGRAGEHCRGTTLGGLRMMAHLAEGGQPVLIGVGRAFAAAHYRAEDATVNLSAARCSFWNEAHGRERAQALGASGAG